MNSKLAIRQPELIECESPWLRALEVELWKRSQQQHAVLDWIDVASVIGESVPQFRAGLITPKEQKAIKVVGEIILKNMREKRAADWARPHLQGGTDETT